MSDEREKVNKKDETEDPDVEAHKALKAQEDDDSETPDVEAHKKAWKPLK